jgi:hypothetical protein
MYTSLVDWQYGIMRTAGSPIREARRETSLMRERRALPLLK